MVKFCAQCGKFIRLGVDGFRCDKCGNLFCSNHISFHSCQLEKVEAEFRKERKEEFRTLKPEVQLPTVKGEIARNELNEVLRMELEFEKYLDELMDFRFREVVNFGKEFSVKELALYLHSLFGPTLFFDSLLTIVQQYSTADVEIVSEKGRATMKTGFNLALFGEPGTGKTFATYNMICGKVDQGIQPHGLPGRNRYCGGMTPAMFIEIGQAYEGRKFNFIVTEFNDWFKYKGMVEPLKLALERGIIKKETMRGTIGPYRFSSFFSVNYNTKVQLKGYKATVGDPNFNAIEDRMLCRLHRLTRKRFEEIASSQMKLALGELTMDKASKIRDHLTLIYAIETSHPAVRDVYQKKPVLLTKEIYERIVEARNAILEYLKYKESLDFSPRLETRAIQLACAMSLISYFRSDRDVIEIDKEATRLAIRFYVEEASVRSKEEFKPEWVLYDLGLYRPDEI
jgi:hypothetical protein